MRPSNTRYFAILKVRFLFYNDHMEDEKRFDQFHYHQTNKNIDGIILVPKTSERATPDTAIESVPPAIPQETEPVAKANHFKKIAGILSTLLLIFLFSILPIRILESAKNMNAHAKEGFNKLEDVYQSAQDGDYEKAKIDLASINKNIGAIDKDLDDIGQKNIFISRFSSLSEGSINDERFFDTVLTLSKIGDKLINDFQLLNEIRLSDINNDPQSNSSLGSRMDKAHGDLASIGSDFQKIKTNIGKLDDSQMNAKEKTYLSLIKNNLGRSENYYNAALNLTGKFQSIAGNSYDKKYLLVFQNNAEIRATGGFIGTYGIITIGGGKLKNIFVDSIYNPDGQISKKIEPPEPLKRITSNWTMRDANWYPDFPTSAKNISNFYELEGGFTPDGIIALDTKLFLDLLEITGPIKLPGHGVEINKDNFISTTQYKTSVDYDPNQNNPKKFLADFAPLLLEKLSSPDPDQQKKILGVLLNNIQEKHVQFYSPQDDIQRSLVDLDVAGQIKNIPNFDYFAYIDSNIGGFKTNDKIKESLTHTIEIDEDGFPIHEVQIARKHDGNYEWPSGTNWAYMRFYLPKGSQVLTAEDFNQNNNTSTKVNDLNVYEEGEKTVIGTWQIINPGDAITLKIKYKSSAKIGLSSYKFLIQKQAGVISQETTINLNYKNATYQEKFNLLQDKETTINFK